MLCLTSTIKGAAFFRTVVKVYKDFPSDITLAYIHHIKEVPKSDSKKLMILPALDRHDSRPGGTKIER